MKSYLFSLFLLSGAILSNGIITVQAGSISKDALPNRGIYGIIVNGTDQEFYARADQVLSIAIQEYTTGAFIVNEVTVDMGGSNQLLRIYTTRPQSMEEMAGHAETMIQNGAIQNPNGTPIKPPSITSQLPAEMRKQLSTFDAQVNSVAEATSAMVVKVWPTSTNAKTVEFSVSSLAELRTFYNNFRDLLVGKPVSVKSDGGTFSQAELANGAAQQPGTALINRIGGVVFTIN